MTYDVVITVIMAAMTATGVIGVLTEVRVVFKRFKR